MNRTKLSFALAALLLVVPRVGLAGDGHDHGHDHGEDAHGHDHSHADEKVVDPHTQLSPEQLFKELEASVAEISAAVKAKELGKLHDLSEKVVDLAAHIAEGVSSDKKARVVGSANNIAKLAQGMHVDADKKDQAAVEAKLPKLESMLTLLKGQI